MKHTIAIALLFLIISNKIALTASQSSTTAPITTDTATTATSMTGSTMSTSAATATPSTSQSSTTTGPTTTGTTTPTTTPITTASTNKASTTASSTTPTTTSTTSTLATTTPYPLCTIVNDNISNGNFELTVTPATLSSNTQYTVKINGSGNATIVLQAMSSSNYVGSWSSGNYTCSGGSPLFEMYFTANSTVLTATWTSVSSQNPVDISAFIKVSTNTSKLIKTLNPVTTTAPPTTTKNAASTTHVLTTFSNLSMAFLFLLISTTLLS